jgi:hypothetical protein
MVDLGQALRKHSSDAVTDDSVGEHAPFHQLNQKPHGSLPLEERFATPVIEDRDPEDNTKETLHAAVEL